MKRSASLLLVLCLSCMAVSAFADTSAGDLTGFWAADRITVNGMDLDQAPGDVVATLTLTADGTAELSAIKYGSDTSSVTGSWSPAGGGIFYSDPTCEAVFCPLEDGVLAMGRGGGIVMYFMKVYPGEAE